jgi:NAD(P)-dependent dehydrogenase (short-subunit alcohol dehydrogenase family)
VSPSPPRLAGRIALVTGASRGIGRALALALAAEGAHLIAVGRTQGALESLDDEVQALGAAPATLVPLDLRDGAAIDRLGGAIFERWGRLDILIAAAGVLVALTPVAHAEPKLWDQVIGANLTANYRLIRSLDPLLRASDAGRAVFLTSGAAARPRAFWGPYAASKAGLEALVRCYADEIEHTRLRVSLLNPGPMRTRMRAQAFPGEDAETLPDPAELAPLVLELVGSGGEPPIGPIDFRAWRAERHAAT